MPPFKPSTRIIPTLCLLDGALVKTKAFGKPQYIGDPLNTVRIFNELEVDELCLLNIRATAHNQPIDFLLIEKIASECFMPVSYGGGINNITSVKKLFGCGIEKVVLNSAVLYNPQLITDSATQYGSQAVVVAIDVQKFWLNKSRVASHSGTKMSYKSPVAWAKEAEAAGAGELLLTSIKMEGTWAGFDTELIAEVSSAVSIPVIAHGGAGSVADLKNAIQSGASAVAAGALFFYQKKGLGVLINYPAADIKKALQ